MTIAIVGAGMAGASAARILIEAGVAVEVFDKARGLGGRMATRRQSVDGADVRFDHGAQVVHVHDKTFAAFVDGAQAVGAAAPWPEGAEARAVVGIPGMNHLVRHALGAAPLRRGVRVTALRQEDLGWALVDEDGAEARGYSGVIVAVPAEQAVPLLEPHNTAFAGAARKARYNPCWTGLFAWPHGDADLTARLAALPSDALKEDGIFWVAHDGGKPGREGAATLVLHADAAWSTAHLEDDPDDVAAHLRGLLVERLGLPDPGFALAHRWRFARVSETSPVDDPFDESVGLGVAGDWLRGPNGEDAFLSGLDVARAVISAGAVR